MGTKQTAEIGLIGGSGLYALDGVADVEAISLDTPYGAPSDTIHVGTVHGRRVAFLARHGNGHRLAPSEVPFRANVYALKLLGVSKVLATGAVGSLREDIAPRSLVIPDQFFDRTRGRINTFYGDGIVVHVAFGDPVSPVLGDCLETAAKDEGASVHRGGTYVCMEGPQFSTRAESMHYKKIGGDVIGMTNLTEARLCREAEIAYATLNLVTDYDAWRPHAHATNPEEIFAVLRENAAMANHVLGAAVRHVPTDPLPAESALKFAILTPLDKVPPETLARLDALLRPYRSGSA